jgi:hypothetical protein
VKAHTGFERNPICRENVRRIHSVAAPVAARRERLGARGRVIHFSPILVIHCPPIPAERPGQGAASARDERLCFGVVGCVEVEPLDFELRAVLLREHEWRVREGLV